MLLISGLATSGYLLKPQSFLQIKAAKANSGNIYVALSGGVTVISGTYPLSGGAGLLDGMELCPGDAYAIPATCFPYHVGTISGQPSIYVMSDLPSSGFSRVFYEIF
jgi:hypothetical protein